MLGGAAIWRRLLVGMSGGCRYAVGPRDALTGIAWPVAADARPVPGDFPVLF
jgi:hypothetical protein